MSPPRQAALGLAARLLTVATLAVLLPWAACTCRRTADPSAPAGGPAPEERFGNDGALVARFAEVRSCPWLAGRLDPACPQWRALEELLQRRREDPESRDRLLTTLRNLLDSQRGTSRLIAADALFFARREPKVIAALKGAARKERSPAAKAAMLRPLCWEPDVETERMAIDLLASSSEAVRVVASTCLGRLRRASANAVAALRRTLGKDRSPAVRESVCAALGTLRAEAAVPELTSALSDEKAGWRCAMALAAVGNRPAWESLQRSAAAEKGRVTAPLLSALASFAGRDFFDREATVALLARLAGQRSLMVVVRQRAALELGALGGLEELRALQASYAKDLSEADQLVKSEIDRALSGATRE